MKRDRADYLIIGNSTAAIGAVEGLRTVDRETPVRLFSREPYHTYSRPLIPYLLAGEIEEQRMYYRPRDFYKRNAVDARLGTEVVSVDPGGRTAKTSEGDEIAFEKLLIAAGGKPFLPSIDGVDAEGVFTFTSWDDISAIAAYVENERLEKAVVIGGGLIGVKAAEALRARGFEVLMVELGPRLLPLALDERASRLADASLRDAGVVLECGTTVERIVVGDGRVCGVVLKRGREVPCELVIVAVGVVPDIGLVKDTVIDVDRGILVDDRCRTSVEGVYAAGDVAQAKDMLLGQSRPIPIFSSAYRQGNVAGINMAGGKARSNGAFAMNAVEVFGLPTVSVGLASAEGDEYEVLSRGDDGSRSYRRIVLRDGRVVGALFVGDIDRAGILTGLIREKVDVSKIKHLLLTDQFGLISLPKEYRKHVVKGEGIEV